MRGVSWTGRGGCLGWRLLLRGLRGRLGRRLLRGGLRWLRLAEEILLRLVTPPRSLVLLLRLVLSRVCSPCGRVSALRSQIVQSRRRIRRPYDSLWFCSPCSLRLRDVCVVAILLGVFVSVSPQRVDLMVHNNNDDGKRT